MGLLTKVRKALHVLSRESSRSVRENVVKFAPFLLLMSLAAFLTRASLGLGALYLLFYMMLLAFLYLFLVMGVEEVRDSFKEAEKYRFPPDVDDSSQSIRERWRRFSREFYKAESSHDPISRYDPQTILPNIVYVAHSLFWTGVVWYITFVILGSLIELGLYADIVIWVDERNWGSVEVASGILSYASGILIVIAEYLFPDVSTENRLIILTLVLVPGFFFLTAARNLVRVFQKINRWVLLWIYDPSGRFRRRDSLGHLVLLILYWVFFEIFAR